MSYCIPCGNTGLGERPSHACFNCGGAVGDNECDCCHQEFYADGDLTPVEPPVDLTTSLNAPPAAVCTVCADYLRRFMPAHAKAVVNDTLQKLANTPAVAALRPADGKAVSAAMTGMWQR